MNSKFPIIVLLFCFALSYGQQEKDSMAIVDILQKEAATWRSGDIEAHADCWQLRTYSKVLISTGTGKILDVDPKYIIEPSPNMVGNGGYAELSNFKMNISGNNAWVSHDEISVSPDGQKSFSKEIRILEKISGEWKLVGQSIHVDGEYKE